MWHKLNLIYYKFQEKKLLSLFLIKFTVNNFTHDVLIWRLKFIYCIFYLVLQATFLELIFIWYFSIKSFYFESCFENLFAKVLAVLDSKWNDIMFIFMFYNFYPYFLIPFPQLCWVFFFEIYLIRPCFTRDAHLSEKPFEQPIYTDKKSSIFWWNNFIFQSVFWWV